MYTHWLSGQFDASEVDCNGRDEDDDVGNDDSEDIDGRGDVEPLEAKLMQQRCYNGDILDGRVGRKRRQDAVPKLRVRQHQDLKTHLSQDEDKGNDGHQRQIHAWEYV